MRRRLRRDTGLSYERSVNRLGFDTDPLFVWRPLKNGPSQKLMAGLAQPS